MTGVGTNTRNTSFRKYTKVEDFFFCSKAVKKFGYYWKCRKQQQGVFFEKEPRNEETTLVSETSNVNTEAILSLSCCSKLHVYDKANFPTRNKKRQQAVTEGA